MEHDTAKKMPESKIKLSDFIPLITIFAIIIAFTLLRQFYMGWCPYSAMRDFMGAFFIIFGGFKILNWHGFVEAYQTYDIIAKRSKLYAYAYPLIEIGLGVAYLTNVYPQATNIITLVVMLVSSIGVAIELSKGKTIVCACLGVVFKVPMTYVTLLEDLLMAAMALAMLIMQ